MYGPFLDMACTHITANEHSTYTTKKNCVLFVTINIAFFDVSPWTRVCNRLSGYSGYSNIRKNLSVRIAT